MSEQNLTPEQSTNLDPTNLDPTAPSAALGTPVTPVTADAEAFAGVQPLSTADAVPVVDAPISSTTENPGVMPKGAKFERPSRAKRQKAQAPASTEPVAGRPRSAPTVRVTVPATSFDFLEGGYNKLRQLRLVLLVCVGAVLALMVAVAGAGLTQSLSVQSINSDTERLASQANQYTANYNDLTRLTINGKAVDGSIIKSAAVERGTALQAAAAQQANMAEILNEVYGLTANGIVVSGVSIVPASPTAPTKNENVTFTATIPNCSQISSSITRIKALPGFGSAAVAVPSCSGSSMALTVTNQVTDSPVDTSTFNLNLLNLGM